MHSRVEVIGVEPENVASYAAAIKAGRPVNGFKEATLADGLAVPIVGENGVTTVYDMIVISDNSC